MLGWLVRCHANRIRAEKAGEDRNMYAMLKPGPSEDEALKDEEALNSAIR